MTRTGYIWLIGAWAILIGGGAYYDYWRIHQFSNLTHISFWKAFWILG